MNQRTATLIRKMHNNKDIHHFIAKLRNKQNTNIMKILKNLYHKQTTVPLFNELKRYLKTKKVT